MKSTTTTNKFYKTQLAIIISTLLLITNESKAQQGVHNSDQGSIRSLIWNKVRYFETVQLGFSNPLFIGGRNPEGSISWGAYPDLNREYRYYFSGNPTARVTFPAWSGALFFQFSDPDQSKNFEDVVNWKTRMTLDQFGKLVLKSGPNEETVFSVENGHVKARKVTVTAGTIPDYVFAGNYQLMPINQLRKFIETNKHLPGIQSEADFAANKNQMDVGEMQLQLLKR